MTHPSLRSVPSFRLVPDDAAIRTAELEAHLRRARLAHTDLRFLADHVGTLVDPAAHPGRARIDFARFDAALALASAQRLVDALAQCHALLPDDEGTT